MADLSTPLDRLSAARPPRSSPPRRDLHTVADLFGFLPRRYLDPATTTDLSTLHEGEYTVRGGDGEDRDDPADAAAAGQMMLTVTVTDGTTT